MSELIRAARTARGWSQTRLLSEIERCAQRKNVLVASTSSLRVYISEWENGRRRLSPPYTEILRTVLGLTDTELVGPAQDAPRLTVDGYDELAAKIDSAHGSAPSVIGTLNSQTELLRTLDRQMGAAQLVDQMSAHLTTLQDALTFAVLPSSRRPLAEALAGASTLAAWQALDVGAADRAWRNYELAKAAAREAEQPKYLTHAMGEQAFVLCDAGKPELASELAGEALEAAKGSVPERLLAWLHATCAELHALNGQAHACLNALEQVAEVMPAEEALRDPEMPSIFLTQAHLTRWRGHTLALMGDDDAVGDLYTALDAMDDGFTRASAGLRCDLAQAHLTRGEDGEVVEQLRAARQLVNQTSSLRHRRRIDQITERLQSRS